MSIPFQPGRHGLAGRACPGKAGPCDTGRRNLIKGLAATALVALVPGLSAGRAAASSSPLDNSPRSLSFYSPNTKESLSVTYFRDGKYVKEALRQVNHHFRDHYCGRVHMIDPALLDYLFRIRKELDTEDPFHVLSGYRTPATNNMLRRRGGKVAKRSLHVYGKAVDIRVPGVGTARLRRAAYRQKCGGVGYYKKDHFVHIDTGQFRAWWG